MLGRQGRRPYAFVVLLALVLLIVGCAPPAQFTLGSPVPQYADPNKPITTRVGESFIIALDANRTTGYSWEISPPLDTALLTQTDNFYEQRGSAPGSSGTDRTTFQARAAGTTTVTFIYRRPFEQGVPPVRTAAFQVTITN